MRIIIETTCDLRLSDTYASRSLFNNLLTHHLPDLNCTFEPTVSDSDWKIRTPLNFVSALCNLLDELQIAFIVCDPCLHVRNLEYDLTPNEIKNEFHEAFDGVLDVEVLKPTDKQPARAKHKGSAKITIQSDILLNTNFYDDILDECEAVGHAVHYFPLVSRPCFIRPWSDLPPRHKNASSSTSRRRRKNNIKNLRPLNADPAWKKKVQINSASDVIREKTQIMDTQHSNDVLVPKPMMKDPQTGRANERKCELNHAVLSNDILLQNQKLLKQILQTQNLILQNYQISKLSSNLKFKSDTDLAVHITPIKNLSCSIPVVLSIPETPVDLLASQSSSDLDDQPTKMCVDHDALPNKKEIIPPLLTYENVDSLPQTDVLDTVRDPMQISLPSSPDNAMLQQSVFKGFDFSECVDAKNYEKLNYDKIFSSTLAENELSSKSNISGLRSPPNLSAPLPSKRLKFSHGDDTGDTHQ